MDIPVWLIRSLAVLLSYLFGAIPSGLVLGLWLRGTDIRQHGSQNIGATNTFRVLGKGLGIMALVLDIGKGVLAVHAFARIVSWDYAPLVCGLAAIIGHVFPVYIRFRGGKGVATGAGVFGGLCPLPTLIGAIVFLFVLGITRMVSASSCIAAIALCIAAWVMPDAWATILPHPLTVRILGTCIALLVLYRHRSNIVRICKGEENRI